MATTGLVFRKSTRRKVHLPGEIHPTCTRTQYFCHAAKIYILFADSRPLRLTACCDFH